MEMSDIIRALPAIVFVVICYIINIKIYKAYKYRASGQSAIDRAVKAGRYTTAYLVKETRGRNSSADSDTLYTTAYYEFEVNGRTYKKDVDFNLASGAPKEITVYYPGNPKKALTNSGMRHYPFSTFMNLYVVFSPWIFLVLLSLFLSK